MTQLDRDVTMGRKLTPMVRKMTEAEIAQVTAGVSPQSRLSPVERKSLLQLGWQEGQPVPENFFTRFQTLVKDYKTEAVRTGLTTEQLTIRSVDDMPPELQERARQLLKETTQAISGAPKTMTFSGYPAHAQESLAKLSAVEIPEAEPPSAPPPDPPQGAVQKNQTEDSIDPEDKQRYLLAIGTGRSFEKEYALFNETIRIRFRATRAGELDQIRSWAVAKTIKEFEGQKVEPLIFLETERRYEHRLQMALQTVSVMSPLPASDLYWAAPEGKGSGLTDWKAVYPEIQTFDDLITWFEMTIGSEALMHAIIDRLFAFAKLDVHLTLHANDTENFWRGI
jgi:hypothetical protein